MWFINIVSNFIQTSIAEVSFGPDSAVRHYLLCISEINLHNKHARQFNFLQLVRWTERRETVDT